MHSFGSTNKGFKDGTISKINPISGNLSLTITNKNKKKTFFLKKINFCNNFRIKTN